MRLGGKGDPNEGADAAIPTDLNGPVVDKPEQLEKIEGVLVDGEQVKAVLDMKGGGTGFIAITDRRVIVYDKAHLSKMKALVTVPFDRIVTIAASDEGRFARGFFGSSRLSLTTTAGTNYDLEFRTAEKAHLAHELIVQHIV